ncbi:MAG: glycosyltransferase [Planctomycetota bacterium]
MALDVAMVVWREFDDLHRIRGLIESQSVQPEKVLLAVNDPDKAAPHLSGWVKPWDLFPGSNSGYAGGLERVWNRGQAEWILVMNTDLEFPPDTLERFEALARSVPDHVGAIGPKVVYPDGRLQVAGGLMMGPEGICRPRGIGQEDRGQFDTPGSVPLLSGCCLLLRRSMLKDVGGFDSGFFMYLEEVDVLMRALWAGWTSHYEPSIRVVHRHGGSAGRYGALQLRLLERNHWWVLPQLPLEMALLSPFRTAERWVKMALGRSRAVPATWQAPFLALGATIEGWAGLPRRLLRRSPRRVDAARVRELMKGHTLTMDEFLELP